MRANTLRFKDVEGFPAFAAVPDCAQRRGEFANRTGETFAARGIGHTRKRARLLKTAPKIEQDKGGQSIIPNGILHYYIGYQCGNAYESYDDGDHHAARPAKRKPQERPQDLSAIKRENWKQVEFQQDYIDVSKYDEISIKARHTIGPLH